MADWSLPVPNTRVELNHFDQIVIGMGTSALHFLKSAFSGSKKATFAPGRTLVVGEEELWTRMPGDHKMGQPGRLLPRR